MKIFISKFLFKKIFLQKRLRKIRPLFIFRIFTIIFFLNFFLVKSRAIDVSARSAVIICADSGDIIWGKNYEEPLAMASTTKIMTSLLALEEANASGNRSLEITEEIVNVEGSSMGLKVGDKVDFETLAKGMLLPSGNDAANATAILVCGSTEKFLARMNQRAKEIGMKNTLFCTPSGLDKDNHHSTAIDMALLGAYAMQNEEFAKIVSSKKTLADFEDSDKKIWLKNHNKLLDLYPFCVGIKTGFTEKAGRCLVSCAEKNGTRLVCVTLNAPDDWNDHIAMYNFGFSQTKHIDFDDTNEKLEIKIKNGEPNILKIIGATKFSRTFKNDSDAQVKRGIQLFKNLKAPIVKGQCVGKINYEFNNKIIGENLLLASHDVKAIKVNFFKKIWNAISSFFKNIFEFTKKIFIK